MAWLTNFKAIQVMEWITDYYWVSEYQTSQSLLLRCFRYKIPTVYYNPKKACINLFIRENSLRLENGLCIYRKPINPYFLSILSRIKQEKDGTKLSKKGKVVDKSPPEKRYKCPECSLMFPHVSALYNHASLRHYRQQVNELKKSK